MSNSSSYLHPQKWLDAAQQIKSGFRSFRSCACLGCLGGGTGKTDGLRLGHRSWNHVHMYSEVHLVWRVVFLDTSCLLAGICLLGAPGREEKKNERSRNTRPKERENTQNPSVVANVLCSSAVDNAFGPWSLVRSRAVFDKTCLTVDLIDPICRSKQVESFDDRCF